MRIKIISLLIIAGTLLLSACLPSKIQEKIEETEEENTKVDKKDKHQDEEITIDNVKLSDEQLKILENQKNDPKEAVFENDLDLRKELAIKIPNKQKSFDNPEEFSQYISYLFFAYHSGKMKPEEFTQEILPYAHKSFLDMLPESKENQIETFKQIQKLYLGQLRSPIESYIITDIEHQERVGEAVFYRKYTQKNGEVLYSITVIKKEDNSWKLIDDSPAPPYTVEPFMNKEE